MTQEPSYRNGDPKEQLALDTHMWNWTEIVITIIVINNNSYYNINSMTKEAGARAVNGGKVMRKTKVSLPRYVCAGCSWPGLSVPNDEMSLSSWCSSASPILGLCLLLSGGVREGAPFLRLLCI